MFNEFLLIPTYLNSNSKIDYYHMPDINGLTEAKNFGVKKSKGDFLLF